MGIVQTKFEYKTYLIFFFNYAKLFNGLLKYLVSDSFKLTITIFTKLLYFI